MNVFVKEPRTVTEAFEVIKAGVEKILPLMSSHNVEALLIEGDLDLVKKKIQEARDQLATVKGDIERAKLEVQLEKEKAKGEVGPIYARANEKLHESVKFLESVKEFVTGVEKKRYQEFMAKAKNEVVAA